MGITKSIRLSKISILHYFKLVFRTGLFLVASVMYIFGTFTNADLYDQVVSKPVILSFLWVVFVSEMILRFFPSNLESMGCQKQFAKNYIKRVEDDSNIKLDSWKSTCAVAIAWILLNGVIGALYYLNIISVGVLLLISLFYSVCDMICILFFCPFQTWFMKNKCCGTCRIYNWDYAMMFTPFVFIKSSYTWSILFVALALLAYWEIMVRIHPERFSEVSNGCLSCANCKEKLCHHKKQLRHFLATNKNRLQLKGNTIVGGVKEIADKATQSIGEVKEGQKMPKHGM